MNQPLVDDRPEDLAVLLDPSSEMPFVVVPDDVSDLDRVGSDPHTPEIWLG